MRLPSEMIKPKAIVIGRVMKTLFLGLPAIEYPLWAALS